MNIEAIENKLGFKFSKEQIQIIKWDKNSLSVIACAGSGKTTTIELNMIYKAIHYNVEPKDILCITFSKTSQLDMDSRYDNLYKKITDKSPFDRPKFTTFHALFKGILEYFKDTKFRVVDMNYYKMPLMKSINFSNDSEYDINEIIESIRNYRASLINTLESLDGIENVTDIPDMMNFTYEEYKTVVKTYNDLKQQNNVIDFEDMQALLLELLEDDEMRNEVVKYFNHSYKHIYIDEFQDISPIQYAIIDIMLNENYEHFTVIGDDDQSIYKFRGSSSDFILDFTNSIQGSHTLYLSTNYRCLSNILNNVKTSIEGNERRMNKDILPHRKGGRLGILKDAANYNKICEYIEQDIEKRGQAFAYENFAVLGRTKFQLSLMADALMERNIDVKFKRKEDSLQMSRYYQEVFGVIRLIKNNNQSDLVRYGYKIVKGLSKKGAEKIANDIQYSNEYWFDVLLRTRNRNHKYMESLKETIVEIKNGRKLEKLLRNALYLLKDFYKRTSKKGDKNYDYMKETVGYLAALARDKSYTYAQFIDNEKKKYLRVKEISENASELGGIAILTFHGSKGLEFDHVYMVGVDNQFIPNANSLQLDIENKRIYDCLANFEEERRLFYVACTRAKRVLYITYINQPSVFIKELKDMENQTIATVLDATKDKLSNYDLANNIFNSKGKYRANITEREKGYIGKKLKKELLKLSTEKQIKNKKKREDYKFN